MLSNLEVLVMSDNSFETLELSVLKDLRNLRAIAVSGTLAFPAYRCVVNNSVISLKTTNR